MLYLILLIVAVIIVAFKVYQSQSSKSTVSDPSSTPIIEEEPMGYETSILSSIEEPKKKRASKTPRTDVKFKKTKKVDA